jgi:hypothetical protein
MSKTQPAGFKFGKYRLEVIKKGYCFFYNGRKYEGVKVRTSDGFIYNSIRLYNSKGKFIKQFLFEEGLEEEMVKIIKSFSGG